MHVGHLRTTIVGDAIARVTEFVGHHADQGQPRRRLGHAVRHADRAPGRRGRGLTGGGPAAHRPERLLPGGAGQVRLRPGVRRPGAGAGRQAAVRHRPGDDGAVGGARRAVQGLPAGHLRPAAGHADRRRHQGRVVLQRHAVRRRRRPGRQGPRQDQRRRAVRLPRGVHQPGRHPAAGDHPEERRRLQLLDDRPRHRQVPGRQGQLRPRHLRRRLGPGAALQDGVRRGARGRLAAGGRPVRARADRHGPGQGRPPAADPGRRPRQAQRPAHRGRRAGPRDTGRDRAGRARRPSTSTRSRRTSASARSSTPTCRPRGTARTSSTGTG